MSEEIEYEDVEYIDCGNEYDIVVTFKLWEYPVGMINAHDIECQGGEIEGKFDFTDTLPMVAEEDEDGECWKCGKRGATDEMGLCIDCRREYQEFMDKDD